MLTEIQKSVHSEFRKYLRIEEGIKGNMLNTIIDVTENKLPALIRKHFRKDFDCIYNDKYSIEEMLSISLQLKSDEEILAGHSGYISSKAIEAYIRFYAHKHNLDLSKLNEADYINESHNLDTDTDIIRHEGRLTETTILHRQRNRAARQKCLEDSGYTCFVCGFNFEKAYGELGKNFMEVHHTKPLATYSEEHVIPQSELCALCSNCHSMVHRHREALDVNELKKIFEMNKGDTNT